MRGFGFVLPSILCERESKHAGTYIEMLCLQPGKEMCLHDKKGAL